MATNLEFIKSQTLDSANSFNITDIFSDKYDVYKITITGLQHSSNRQVINTRVINSGGVVSTSNYEYAGVIMRSDTTFQEKKNTSDTSWVETLGEGIGNGGSGSVMYVINPYDSSKYTFMLNQYATYYDITGPLRSLKYCGVYKVAEQITGLNIFDNGNIQLFDGKLTVYGVK